MSDNTETVIFLFAVLAALLVGIVSGYKMGDNILIENYCYRDISFTLEQFAQCKQDMQQYK